MRVAVINWNCLTSHLQNGRRLVLNSGDMWALAGGDLWEHAKEHGQRLAENSSTKEIYALYPPNVSPLVVKSFGNDYKGALHEVLCRVIMRRILEPTNDNRSADKIFIPKAFTFRTTSNQAVLFTEFCNGATVNQYNYNCLTPKSVASLIASVLLSSLTDLYTSSVPIDCNASHHPNVSIIDCESLDFSNPTRELDDSALLTLSLLKEFLGDGKSAGISSTLESIGDHWLDKIFDDNFINEFTLELIDSFGHQPHGPLGDILPSIENIIKHLQDRVKYFKKNDYDPFKTTDSSPISSVSQGATSYDLKDLIPYFIEEIEGTRLPEAHSLLGKLFGGTIALESSDRNRLRIHFHTIKGNSETFNSLLSCSDLYDSAFELEKMFANNTNVPLDNNQVRTHWNRLVHKYKDFRESLNSLQTGPKSSEFDKDRFLYL